MRTVLSYLNASSKAFLILSSSAPSLNILIPIPKFVDFGLITTGFLVNSFIILKDSFIEFTSIPFGTLIPLSERTLLVTLLFSIIKAVI